jgi:pyruvate dehydrogenase E1 component
VAQVLDGVHDPIVAASDYVSAVPMSIAQWLPQSYVVLGTDGFGRSEAREDLRRFFEVDAENIALAALSELARQDRFPKVDLAAAIQRLGLDPEKPNPARV